MKGCSLEKKNGFSGDMKSNLEIFRNEKHDKNWLWWGSPDVREAAEPLPYMMSGIF